MTKANEIEPFECKLLEHPDYAPGTLLDTLIKRMALKNDAALSRRLKVAAPVISKIRHRRLPVGASLLLRMHDVTAMPINELRSLMGVSANA